MRNYYVLDKDNLIITGNNTIHLNQKYENVYTELFKIH